MEIMTIQNSMYGTEKPSARIEVRQSLETILPRHMATCQVGLFPPANLPYSDNEGYPVQTSQMSPLIHEVNEKPGPQFAHLHLLLISTVS